MILNRIIEYKKKEITESKDKRPQSLLEKNLAKKRGRALAFKEAILKPGVSLIAEVKKASPSKGVFREEFDSVNIALAYEKAGASAISVLTESRFFQGSPENLIKVKNAVNLPVLRKDFIIDPYQLYETRYFEADALLLITAILKEEQLKDFILLARELDLAALVEVHSREELVTALNCGAEIIGINNRDLKTFKTSISTTLELANLIPEHCLLVSESGIASGSDVKKLAQAGVDAILVGEALVTCPSVDNKIQELLGGAG